MKNTLPLLLVSLLVLAGCASKPMSVAKKYFRAIEARDYETAKTYLTSGSVETFELLYTGDETTNTFQVKRVDEAEDGMSARVYYLMDDDPDERYIDMIKTDGVWLINLSSDK
jgi:hypothetical protein